MSLARIAAIYSNKMAAEIEPATLSSKLNNLEEHARFTADILYNLVDRYNIVRACSESEAKKGQGTTEKQAIKGYLFCKAILSIIDRLKADQDKLPLKIMHEGLRLLLDQISAEHKKNNFADEVELIFQMLPSGTQYERKLRDEQYGKFRTAMSELVKSAKKGIKNIQDYYKLREYMEKQKIEVPPEEEYLPFEETNLEQELPEDFQPTRAPLSVYDIVDFIRQHGDEYGIESRDDWGKVMTYNPELKSLLTGVINAINRGHIPKDKEYVKEQIKNILTKYEK